MKKQYKDCQKQYETEMQDLEQHLVEERKAYREQHRNEMLSLTEKRQTMEL
jgi:hypothetical protein